MNLSVSNLAWDFNETYNIIRTLNSLNIKYIEGVLTKISTWDLMTDNDIIQYKKQLNNNFIEIKSLQSLFYNTNIRTLEQHDDILSHINRIINYSKILGVKVLTFGSPNIRKKFPEWELKNLLLFNKIDKLLDNTGIEMSIEPNSQLYGGEYFIKIDDIVDFLKKSKFRNIKTMIDTNNLILEGDCPSNSFKKNINYINHIHISEKDLNPLENFKMHEKFSKTLKYFKYKKIITLEMKKTENLKESIEKFSTIYN